MAPCCHEWTRPGTTRRHAGRRRFARTRRCPPVGLASSSTASARNPAATSPPEGSPRSAAAFTVAARRTSDVERGPWRRAAVAPVSGRWRCAAQRHCRRWRWTADRRRDCARVLGRVRVGRRETRHPQCNPHDDDRRRRPFHRLRPTVGHAAFVWATVGEATSEVIETRARGRFASAATTVRR
jgi:hypothetical protein